MPRRKPTPRTAAQIKSDTGRLNALKGAAMRDLKAIASLTKPKRRTKAEPAQGIHMGKG